VTAVESENIVAIDYRHLVLSIVGIEFKITAKEIWEMKRKST